MRAAKGGTVSCVGGREGSAILEGGETYASAGGHGDGNVFYHNDRWQSGSSYERMPSKDTSV